MKLNKVRVEKKKSKAYDFFFFNEIHPLIKLCFSLRFIPRTQLVLICFEIYTICKPPPHDHDYNTPLKASLKVIAPSLLRKDETSSQPSCLEASFSQTLLPHISLKGCVQRLP